MKKPYKKRKPVFSQEERDYFKSIAAMVRQLRESATVAKKGEHQNSAENSAQFKCDTASHYQKETLNANNSD